MALTNEQCLSILTRGLWSDHSEVPTYIGVPSGEASLTVALQDVEVEMGAREITVEIDICK
jgi:hypothetical protein